MSGAIFETKQTKILGDALLVAWHPKLVELYLWELIRYGSERILVTCAYEDRGYASVHATVPLRGFDLRERLFKNAEEVAQDINHHWIYDVDRPELNVVRLHAVCGKCRFDHEPPIRDVCDGCGKDIKYNWHFHNQVHDNTIMIKAASKGDKP